MSITGAEGDATRLRNEITVTVNLISGSAGAIGMASLEIDLTEVPPGTYLVRLVEGPWLCMQPRDGWPKTFTATVP